MIPFTDPGKLFEYDPYSRTNKDNARRPLDNKLFESYLGGGSDQRGTLVRNFSAQPGETEKPKPDEYMSSEEDTDGLTDEGIGFTPEKRIGTSGEYPYDESVTMFGKEQKGDVTGFTASMQDQTAYQRAMDNYEQFKKSLRNPSGMAKVRSKNVKIL